MYLYRFLRVDSSIRNKGYMRNCKTCGKFINNSKLHLGYKECIRCSDVEKYSAHIVYPHKTGGYVQPVSSTTKKHLDSMKIMMEHGMSFDKSHSAAMKIHGK